MAEYVVYPLDSDPDEIAQAAFDYLTENVEGYSIEPARLETWLIEAISFMIAELLDVASDVPPAIFRYLGKSLLGFPPIDATTASADTNWTLIDDAGYTIPAGTAIGIRNTDDELSVFEVADDVIVPLTETTAENVLVIAQEAGVLATNLNVDPEFIDALDFAIDVALVAPTSGGEDAETDDEYLNRLTTYLQLLTPRPVLARDAAVLARVLIPEVARAAAIDNLIPEGFHGEVADVDDAEKATTVIVVDEDGLAVSSGVKTAVTEMLESMREQQFLFSVIDPTYTEVSVTTGVIAYPGFDLAQIELDIAAALEEYFSPGNWGNTSVGDSLEWNNEPTVRTSEVSALINTVSGVHYVASLTTQLGAGTDDASDKVMTGLAPLPTPGTMDATASFS